MIPIHALLTRILAFTLTALALLAPAANAQQQGLFQTAITVNDLVITNYELQQRELLLTVLRAPGSPTTEARKGLIDDRLRLTATKSAGISPTEEQITEGMEEFAGRANLSAEEFIKAVGQAGVSAETFRDFVAAGLAWRELVQGRFGARSQVTEPEVDRAMALQGSAGGARVLLAEIVLPLTPQVAERNQALAQRLSETIKSESAFSAAARRYSASPTRGRGGRLEWLPLGNVPPQLRAAVLTLGPGEVSEPLSLGNAVGVFQLRGLEETEAASPETQALEYVTVLFPGGRTPETLAQAKSFEDRYDTCDDLYAPAKDLPSEYFERTVLPTAEVPGDISLELAKLDSNEVSTALTRQNGQFLVYLMLCGRTLDIPLDENGEEVDLRARVREQLFNQRITSFADSYLEELRADAIIVEQ
ncbi:periplasmic chaperone for outer membrane proteins SurA [Litoreibacter meonggei]|uniref:Parvulin-like PPIase n=1 Tax=Litoreibacter meonggei TaxID=1049199 RepID=A0A497VDJ8_9RHOB|nr:peptidylprolyl isomerase [Litoreibacter meonggei]RLJ41570.1 periplasmic chaperone for outer membrane proteins SurA [Litoreibacter meonggei]